MTKHPLSSTFIFVILAALACPSCKTEDVSRRIVEPQIRIPKQAPVPQNRDALQVGDTLEVFVMEDSSFNGVFKVREKGDIIIPKVGRVSVLGLSVDAVQERIKKTLESSQLTTATVIADRLSSAAAAPVSFEETPKILVYLTGKVTRPGQHMLAVNSGESISAFEAVLIAGGVAPFADERDAYILRRSGGGNRARIPLDLRAIRQGKAADVPLVNGDMICVPERRFAL